MVMALVRTFRRIEAVEPRSGGALLFGVVELSLAQAVAPASAMRAVTRESRTKRILAR
jgi:hypothetical protein